MRQREREKKRKITTAEQAQGNCGEKVSRNRPIAVPIVDLECERILCKKCAIATYFSSGYFFFAWSQLI
jgi:hypothetical protein